MSIQQLVTSGVSLLDRLNRGLDRLGYWLLLPFSIYYFAVTVRFAAGKLFWYDEIFTVRLATLPGLGDIWAALATGLEQLPPLTHIMVRWSQTSFGMGHVASRLPMIVAFWVMCVCLFVIVARRGSFAAAAVAAMFPLATNAYLYAAEARPYALMLAFGALACVFWIRGRDGKRWASAGLALALAAAVSSHYYGCLLLLPFGAAQLADTWREKRLHPWRWLAMLAGILLPLVVYSPLIASAWEQAAIQLNPQPRWSAVLGLYGSLLHWQLTTFVIVMVAGACWSSADYFRDSGEMSLLSGFAALPMAAGAAGILVTGVLYRQYAVGVVIGFALALGYALAMDRLRVVASPLLIGLAILFPLNATKNAQHSATRVPPFAQQYSQPARNTQTVATVEGVTYLPLWHYATESLRDRVVFIAGEEDVDTKDLRVFARLFGGRIIEIDEFQASADRYLIAARIDSVVSEFERELSAGFTLRMVSRFGNYGLFRIEPADPAHRTPPG